MNIRQEDIKVVLNEIETRYGVSEWSKLNFEIWPFLRIRLWYDLSLKALSINQETSIQHQTKVTLVIRVLMAPFRWLYHSLKDYKKNYFSIPSGDIFVLGDGVSFTKIDGKYFDKFSDSLDIILKSYNLKTVRADSTSTFHKPRYFSSYFIQPILDIIIVKALIMSKLKSRKLDLSNYNEVYAIANKYGVASVLEKNSIQNRAYKIHMVSVYFEKLLRKKQFKAAMSVCYYADIGLALNLACSRIGIISFDIQHGVQGDNHGAYGSWKNVSDKGYKLLPDYFLCWSELEKKAIDNWSINLKKHQSIITGNLFADLWRNNKYGWDKQYSEVLNVKIKNSLPRILLTLSWDISDEKSIGSTLKVIAKTQHKYEWLIRLHPSMHAEKPVITEMLKNNNITRYELDAASELPLFSLLSNIDTHITHSSSAAIEASYFGVGSIITSEYGWTALCDQVSSDFICKAVTESAITNNIEKMILNHNQSKKQTYSGELTTKRIETLIKTFHN